MPVDVPRAFKTMMGLDVNNSAPAGTVAPIAPPTPAAASSPAVAVPATPRAGPIRVANTHQTMMGIPVEPAAAASYQPPAPAPRSERPPLMGGPEPGAAPLQLPATQPLNIEGPATAAGSEAYPEEPLPAEGSRRVLWIAVAVVAVLLAGGTALALVLGRRAAAPARAVPLQAQLVPGERGALAMTVQVPGARPGTVVRYREQQHAVDPQGRATFAVTDLADRVGAIDLPVDVTAPGQAAEHRLARVFVAYRVDPDLSGMAAERPELQLVFHVPPGSRLLVNGNAIATDPARGVGAATISNVAPLATTGPDALESSFNVQVNASDGTIANGVYHLRVPRTPLLVEHPLEDLVTSAPRVTVRGRAPGAARVTVNGAAVPVVRDTFQAVIPLAAPGRVALNVVAYSTGGAPALRHLEVTRADANDRGAIARYLGASPASGAEVARNALTDGTRVRLRGRVLGAPREHDGAQTFQLVVEDRACTAERCLVWADTEPGTAPADGATVEVVGVVAGRRAWVTAANERRTDPVIDAAFVLDAGR